MTIVHVTKLLRVKQELQVITIQIFKSLLCISSPEPLGSQGELIVYPSSRRLSAVHHFQRSSSLKPLGQSEPNFMWSILWKGDPKFIKMCQIDW